MKIILVNKCECVIQAYLKDDFVNLWSTNCEGAVRGMITVDLKNKTIESNNKNAETKIFISEIDIEKLISDLDLIM